MWNANTLSRELNVYSANLPYSLEENSATKTLNSSANCFIFKSSLSTFNWLFRKSGFNKTDWCWIQYTSLSQYNYVDYLFFFVFAPSFALSHDSWVAERLTLILSMQSVVLDARTHDSLAKAETAAGGSTVTRALASSAHFLCSGSDTVHQRIFFASNKTWQRAVCATSPKTFHLLELVHLVG